MGLLAPIFLAGALAAAVPIVLHLLKREPEARVRFAAVRFLRRAPVEHADRRHLRELLLLALRIAAVLLLALAFARPFFGSDAQAGSARVTVVALDTSLSVSAPEQFARARALAHAAVDRASSRDPVAVITFADAAEVAVRPTTDRALVRAAIEQAVPGAGATRYRAALSAAVQQLQGAPGTVVVVTDLQASGWDEGDRMSLPAAVDLQVADVGAAPPNLAVTSLHVENDRLVAAIRNLGDAPRETTLTLSVHDTAVPPAPPRVATTSAASVAPGETVRVTMARAPGTLASVSVDDASGTQGDNARFLVLDDANRPAVLVITAGGDLSREAFYLQQALTVAGGPATALVEAQGAAAGAIPAASALQPIVAVVLTTTRGLDRPGRERLAAYVQGGGGLLIAAGPDVDGAVAGEILGSPSITSAVEASAPGGRAVDVSRTLAPEDLRHPIFLAFGGNAAALGVPRFTRISSLAGGCAVLARFTTGETALAECARGRGRALVFASDLDGRGNDFPRHAAFLPFVREAVDYLAGPGPRAAEYVVGDVPAGVAARPGFAQVPTAAGGGSRWAAVNVDPGELDPTRMSEAEFGAAITRLQDAARLDSQRDDRQREERQHIWQYLLVAMLVIMAVESLAGMRAA